MRAARAGATADVAALLAAGEAVDAVGDRGDTALHLAARAGHADTAALLLAHGASTEVTDRTGRTPLDTADLQIPELHRIRQHYHRHRFHSPDIALAEPLDAALQELEERGLARVPGAVDEDTLAALRRDFESFVAHVEDLRRSGAGEFEHYDDENFYWTETATYATNNAFRFSPRLAEIATEDRWVELARRYVGRTPIIQRALGFRYPPADIPALSQFRFHHDIEDRRLKLMVLLTDTADTDQAMAYAVGSHKLMHPWDVFRGQTCPLDYVEKAMGRAEVARAAGRAGDVILFDSNGAHSARRSPDARTRDVFMVEYNSAPSRVFGTDLPPALADPARRDPASPLHHLVTGPKLWESADRREVPSWVEDLPHPDRWVRPATPTG